MLHVTWINVLRHYLTLNSVYREHVYILALDNKQSMKFTHSQLVTLCILYAGRF